MPPASSFIASFNLDIRPEDDVSQYISITDSTGAVS
jgi:hypothetical protein